MIEIVDKRIVNNLDYQRDAFNSVGWFIPPYVTLGFGNQLARQINEANGSYSQEDLEKMLSNIYSPEYLAAMVLERYPITPVIQDYCKIISEAAIAHFSNLDHIAVAGLMPVIEGAGNSLAKEFSVKGKGKNLFKNLAEYCKKLSSEKNIGAVGEVASMMDSFKEYTDKHLYINSENYLHTDKTNRHGILHGTYTDDDYGRPINFYKAIAAVDFLCFISAFRAPISWMAPNLTKKSEKLSEYYRACFLISEINPARNISSIKKK
jgi:hypothetical protein